MVEKMKSKYMLCGTCGKELLEGEIIIEDDCCIGGYCSIECWAKRKGKFKYRKLTEELVKDAWGIDKWDSEGRGEANGDE